MTKNQETKMLKLASKLMSEEYPEDFFDTVTAVEAGKNFCKGYEMALKSKTKNPVKKSKFKVGSYVQICNNGSIGKVVQVNVSSKEYQIYTYDVEWIYGRDVNNEVMKDKSRSVHEANLEKILKSKYMKVYNHEGWA